MNSDLHWDQSRWLRRSSNPRTHHSRLWVLSENRSMFQDSDMIHNWIVKFGCRYDSDTRISKKNLSRSSFNLRSYLGRVDLYIVPSSIIANINNQEYKFEQAQLSIFSTYPCLYMYVPSCKEKPMDVSSLLYYHKKLDGRVSRGQHEYVRAVKESYLSIEAAYSDTYLVPR